jgi:hypothetical protein
MLVGERPKTPYRKDEMTGEKVLTLGARQAAGPTRAGDQIDHFLQQLEIVNTLVTNVCAYSGPYVPLGSSKPAVSSCAG